MMKKKLSCLLHFLENQGGKPFGTAFEKFSNCAQRLGVYTALDYIDI